MAAFWAPPPCWALGMCLVCLFINTALHTHTHTTYPVNVKIGPYL